VSPTGSFRLLFDILELEQRRVSRGIACRTLAAPTGIDLVTIPKSAAYLQSWIRRLKGDPKLVIRAAAQTQKAVDTYSTATNQKAEAGRSLPKIAIGSTA
jgi:antirestriction protein ArdC